MNIYNIIYISHNTKILLLSEIQFHIEEIVEIYETRNKVYDNVEFWVLRQNGNFCLLIRWLDTVSFWLLIIKLKFVWVTRSMHKSLLLDFAATQSFNLDSCSFCFGFFTSIILVCFHMLTADLFHTKRKVRGESRKTQINQHNSRKKYHKYKQNIWMKQGGVILIF